VNPTLALPVDAILPELVASLRQSPNIVIEAPPGAGKTTRVPPTVLNMVSGEVVVLEPRRIAARMAARRVAEELGEAVGETVGYQVRFEERVSPRTRLRFVTEGILTRRLLTDPTLKGVGAVVIDEFHERHLESDLALALLKRLQWSRPQFRIVVMSATLDAGPIAAYLGACPILRSEGRLFSLSINHLPYSPDPTHVQVRRAVERLGAGQHSGNVLVFLPGIAEIRRAARECETVASKLGMLVLPLHGDLSPAEQDRALLPTAERKLILATNVAESSVTVEGVTAVIDSGLARFASHSSWTGLPTLQIGRISKAAAIQRAGRAGRTGPGQVLRLYPEEDFLLRAEHDAPEIAGADLSQLLLNLRAMNIEHFSDLDWLTSPPQDAMDAADRLLDLLGATGNMAKRLVRYPLTPRLARIVVEGMDRGVGEEVCRAAAVLGLGDRSQKSDLLEVLDLPPDLKQRQHTEQLLRIARPPKGRKRDDQPLLISLLAGFPDRVARRRSGNRILLSKGLSAEVLGEAPAYEFMLAIDAEDRRENALPLVRLTSRIEPEWLLDLFPDRVHESSTLVFNRITERVEKVSMLLYDKLVIEESRGPASEVEAADMLAQMALDAGLEKFVDKEALNNFLSRLSFAGLDAPDISQILREVCLGCHSFKDLKTAAVTFIPMLERSVDSSLLNEFAPASIRLKGGRQVKVQYDQTTPPWIASRLQDFFGMKETPTIGSKKTPLVIHLLAPNHRAVQTTTDLAGFWQRLYPQVRRELQRRYPRHAWPEFPDTQRSADT
jgi:ATP-dependent helicase HrpB